MSISYHEDMRAPPCPLYKKHNHRQDAGDGSSAESLFIFDYAARGLQLVPKFLQHWSVASGFAKQQRRLSPVTTVEGRIQYPSHNEIQAGVITVRPSHQDRNSQQHNTRENTGGYCGVGCAKI